MKVRDGLVSNSSSTSFTFCFNGRTIKSLTNLILSKHQKEFDLSYDEYHCNVMDVVRSIERCIEQQTVRCRNIDKLIEETEFRLHQTEDAIKEYKINKDNYYIKYFSEIKKKEENKINKLKFIKESGLTNTLVIEFGDNHGHITGGDIGYAMDYDGRSIDIRTGDLVVFTEQNR